MHLKPLVHSQEVKGDAAVRVPAREEGTLNIIAVLHGSHGMNQSSENQEKTGKFGNPAYLTATRSAVHQSKEERAARNRKLSKDFQRLWNERVDIGNELIGLWYANAMDDLSEMANSRSEGFIMRFRPDDEIPIKENIASIKLLGWKIDQVIGCPNTAEVFVIFER